MASDHPTGGALTGTTVVALEQAVAAPFATRQLAELGARVIKIERPGVGDFARDYDRAVHGQASYFVWLNRGKQSVELNLKDAGDAELVRSMVDHADVFVQNLAPGAATRLGLDPAELRRRRPELITCSISGYGAGGPYSARKAYDLLVQCEAGLLSITGGDEPAKVGISVADIAAGMYAFTGILTALLERSHSGSGSELEVSMLDALGEWMLQPTYYSMYGGHGMQRTGARHRSIAPYGPYRTGDGATVFIGVQNDREWAALCSHLLERPDLIHDNRFVTNSDRVAHNDEITVLIESALAHLCADDVTAQLDDAQIATARLRTPTEFAQHPQLGARDRWRTIDAPAGPVRALRPPVTVAGRDEQLGSVPRLGEHTELVRREFGSTPQIDTG